MDSSRSCSQRMIVSWLPISSTDRGRSRGGVRLALPPSVLMAADLGLEAGEGACAVIGCEHFPAHFFLKSKAISLASQAEKLTVSPALIPAASRVGRSPGRSR